MADELRGTHGYRICGMLKHLTLCKFSLRRHVRYNYVLMIWFFINRFLFCFLNDYVNVSRRCFCLTNLLTGLYC